MNKAEIRKLISKYQDKQLRELICLLVEKNIWHRRHFLNTAKNEKQALKLAKEGLEKGQGCQDEISVSLQDIRQEDFYMVRHGKNQIWS